MINRKTKLILWSCWLLMLILTRCKDEKEHAPWEIEGTIVTDNGKTPMAGQQVTFKRNLNPTEWEDLPKLETSTDANGYFKVTVPGNIRHLTGFVFPTPGVYLQQYVGMYFHADTTARQVKILLPKKAAVFIHVRRVDPTKTKPLTMWLGYQGDPEYYAPSGGLYSKPADSLYAEFYLDVPLDRPIHSGPGLKGILTQKTPANDLILHSS